MAKPNTKNDSGQVIGLRVTAKTAAFRRGGIEFTRETTIVSLEGLTSEQIDTIRNEPMLVVEEIVEE